MATRRNEAAAGIEREDPPMTLSETAYRRLREEIISGSLRPGQPLRLELLRQRYGLSFSPLREALNRLQSERLVASAALRGFTVAPISADEMRDAVDARILIECEALRRSIRKGDDDWEAALVASFHALSLQDARLARLGQSAGQADIMALEARHDDFHHALISRCGSPRLLILAQQLSAETQRYRLPSLIGRVADGARRDVSGEHRGIMETALARDETESSRLLADHYERTAAAIMRWIEGGKSVVGQLNRGAA